MTQTIKELRKHGVKFGDCFTISLQSFFELSNVGGDHPDAQFMLVHGAVVSRGGNTKGVRHMHAWIEQESQQLCIDPSGKSLPKALYYSVGEVREEELRRYTLQQAREEAFKTMHAGPWDAKLNALQDKALQEVASRVKAEA